MALGSENQATSPHSFYAMPYSKPETVLQDGGIGGGVSVVRRNARERNRVKQVNNGFSQLRQHIPVAIVADLSNGRRGIGPGANKKLSKVSTLRMAVEYIRRLQRLIDDNDQQQHKKQQQQQLQMPQQQQQLQQQQHQQHLHSMQQQQQQFSYQQQLQQQQQQFYALQQQLELISPSGSCSSNSNSSNSNSSNNNSGNSNNFYAPSMKLEAEDYPNTSCSSSGEEDDILDYISLWQDDL